LTNRTTCTSLASIVLTFLAFCSLTGCFDDSSDASRLTSGLPNLGANPAGNSPPSIQGQPATAARPQQMYDFTPQASDPDGDSLRFEIHARPPWATFNPNTGRLYGTPTAAGTFSDITISVTDGKSRASLPAFAITVAEGPAGTGYAKLSWSAPMTNTDGSALTDLAGFRVYYGLKPDAPSERIDIADPAARSTLIQGLSPGTWYFSISAYSARGVESARTPPASKTI
jgi:hypothetical protein